MRDSHAVKDCIEQTEQLTIADVTEIANQPYDKIAMYRQSGANVYTIADHLGDGFSGCVLVDSIFYKGPNDRWRFIEVHIENGEIVNNDIRTSPLNEDILAFTNRIARVDPNI